MADLACSASVAEQWRSMHFYPSCSLVSVRSSYQNCHSSRGHWRRVRSKRIHRAGYPLYHPINLSLGARAGLTLRSAHGHPDIVNAMQEVYEIVDANEELFVPLLKRSG